MLGEAIEEKVLKPTNLKGSRWVPHMYKAVKATTHSSNYKTTNLTGLRWVPYMYKAVKVTTHSSNSLISFCLSAPSAGVVGGAKNILRYLREFMHFHCDALEPISRLSLKLQEDQLTPAIYC